MQHFKTMERMMSSDLHNWLCNIYIEVCILYVFSYFAQDVMVLLVVTMWETRNVLCRRYAVHY